MLVWRVVNNIDAKRDIFFGKDFVGFEREFGKNLALNSSVGANLGENSAQNVNFGENLAKFVQNCVCIDATAKGELEGHKREWAKQVDCTKEIIENLVKRKLIENDEKLFKKFELF